MLFYVTDLHFLGSLAKRVAAVSFVMSVYRSVHVEQTDRQTDSHRTDVHDISQLQLFFQYVDDIPVLFDS